MPFQIDPNNYYASYLSAANELEGMIGGDAARPQMELIRGGAAQGNVAQINTALKTLNAMAEQSGKAQLAQQESRSEAVKNYNSNVGEAFGRDLTFSPHIQAEIDKAKSKGDLSLAASIIKGALNAPQGTGDSDAAKKEKDAKELKIRQLTQRLTSTQGILRDPELEDTFGRSLPIRAFQESTAGTGSQIRAQLESLDGSFLSGGMAEMKAGAGSTGNPSAGEATAIARAQSPISLGMQPEAAIKELLSITNKTIRSLKELGANPAIYTSPDSLQEYNESPDAGLFDTNAASGNTTTGSGVVNKPKSFLEQLELAK